ncbi:MAG TPA: hypothetical protein VNT79_19205 [Phycisphaerae bacterium]|nr:hypothetical protein [Phycisphaerae bacterium]
MMPIPFRNAALAIAIIAMSISRANGQITVPGANGSDGAFSPVSNTTINLALSPNGAFDAANPDPATPLTGVYDAAKWAVVFRYTNVNIPAGVTVNFENHPKGAPVVWLVSGSVTIAGTININGSAAVGASVVRSIPGPGGFAGGARGLLPNIDGTAGSGPGGASYRADTNDGAGSGGGFGLPGSCGWPSCAATAAPGIDYGNLRILPLIGGSGGGAGRSSFVNVSNAGAGGGAILMAAANTITITGQITANGGDGSVAAGRGGGAGSGGGIRLVANQINSTGSLRAVGGSAVSNFGDSGGAGAVGRIRAEGNNVSISDSTPSFSAGLPGATATIWPPASAPRVTITQVHTQAAPADPKAGYDFPADVAVTNPNVMAVRLQCANVPIDGSADVYVRVVPNKGEDFIVEAVFVSGTLASSIWEAQTQLPDGFSVLQARAILP